MNTPLSPDLASLRVQIDNIDQQLLTLLNQRAPGRARRRGQEARGHTVLSPRPRGTGHRKSRWPTWPFKAPMLPSGARSCRPAWHSSRPSASPFWGLRAPSASRPPSNSLVVPPTLSIAPTSMKSSTPPSSGGAIWRCGCRKFRSKAWSPGPSTCFAHPTHVVGEVTCWYATTCCAPFPRSRASRPCSAPRALAQCQAWLSKHLPHVERRPVSSNAEGARLAATNPAWAALASERAATQFGLHIVAHAIQDDAYNRTRFAIICLPHAGHPRPDRDCTSLVVSVPNRPGAVHDLLVPLKKHRRVHDAFRIAPGTHRPVGILFLHRHRRPPQPAPCQCGTGRMNCAVSAPSTRCWAPTR